MGATLCLTFDNLGEAAEVGAGARDPGAPLGGHPTATETLPRILELLDSRGVTATFFLEGLNAELYPELLRRIVAEGHEVAYHSWTHERWAELDAAAQVENLRRGLAAFSALGIDPDGFRPPGGGLGPGGLDVIREAGLRYCSPAAADTGPTELAVVPFEWRHVDASCVIPDMEGPMRGPAEFLGFITEELDSLERDGDGTLTIVLHPFMLEWFGEERLEALLDRVAAARDAGLRVATCDEAAEPVPSRPSR